MPKKKKKDLTPEQLWENLNTRIKENPQDYREVSIEEFEAFLKKMVKPKKK